MRRCRVIKKYIRTFFFLHFPILLPSITEQSSVRSISQKRKKYISSSLLIHFADLLLSITEYSSSVRLIRQETRSELVRLKINIALSCYSFWGTSDWLLPRAAESHHWLAGDEAYESGSE